jgi:hypothetical protein
MNHQIEVAPLVARTTSWATQLDLNEGAYGRLYIDVTAVAATPSVTVTLRAVDKVSGKKHDILVSAAITGVGTTVLRVGPMLTAVANQVANDFLPPVLEVNFAHADADSITYSAGLDVTEA